MKTHSTGNIISLFLILMVSLTLGACGSPSEIESTGEAATSTPDAPVLVTTLEEMVGVWLSHCGGGPCTMEFLEDGTYKVRYTKEAGPGAGVLEFGEVTMSEGLIHLVSTSGACDVMSSGFYQAYLTRLDGQPYRLEFMTTQDDECLDRQQVVTFPMKYVIE